MLRISKKVSADDLAEALGKTGANRKQYVYDLERGRIKRIDLTTLIAITKKLKVPISYFLDVNETERKDGSDTISIDEKVIESGWREKYYEAIKENSELKTKIIELISTIKD